jgi:outer membrane lipoprotein SlyB
MSTTLDTTSSSSNGSKALWATVGALAVAVVGLAGTLIYTQTKPAATPVAALSAPAAAMPPVTAAQEKPADEVAPPPPVTKPVVTAPKPAPKVVHKTAPAPAPAPVVVGSAGPVVAPEPPPVRHVCAECGRIEAVTPVERKGAGSGLGAVAGGVLGAVVGNQVGGGTGRSIATVLGAVGGGFAGNAVEKNIKKTTVYQVQVRMEDGSVRTVEQATAPAVGERVVIDGNGALRAQ